MVSTFVFDFYMRRYSLRDVNDIGAAGVMYYPPPPTAPPPPAPITEAVVKTTVTLSGSSVEDGRALQSFTFRFHVSAFCGKEGAFRLL